MSVTTGTFAVTVHRAESEFGKLAHLWNHCSILTNCGIQCGWNNGRPRLATGWIQASETTPKCPECFPTDRR